LFNYNHSGCPRVGRSNPGVCVDSKADGESNECPTRGPLPVVGTMDYLHQEAADATKHFRVSVCGSKQDFMRGRVTVLRYDAPDWLREAVGETHATLGLNRKSDPDNFKFDVARRALEAIAANPDAVMSEIERSFASKTDLQTTDLLAWLCSHPAQVVYCDRVLEDDRRELTTRELLRRAQALELSEVSTSSAQPWTPSTTRRSKHERHGLVAA
jgi:hypothetical protein